MPIYCVTHPTAKGAGGIVGDSVQMLYLSTMLSDPFSNSKLWDRMTWQGIFACCCCRGVALSLRVCQQQQLLLLLLLLQLLLPLQERRVDVLAARCSGVQCETEQAYLRCVTMEGCIR